MGAGIMRTISIGVLLSLVHSVPSRLPRQTVDVNSLSDQEFLALLFDTLGDGDTGSAGGDTSHLTELLAGNSTAQEGPSCCVPAWRCNDNAIDETSTFPGDPRREPGNFNVDLRQATSRICPNAIDVCCFSPISDVTEPPPPPQPRNPQCGVRNPQGVITSFQGFQEGQSQFGEFPWMAAVLTSQPRPTDPRYGYLGGGSLLTPNIVLTAAHKVDDRRVEELSVRLGEWDFSQDEEPIAHQQLRVSRIAVHPDYSRRSLANNVALLFLEGDAVLSSTVDTVCLPSPGQNFIGASCFSSGWGKDNFGQQGRYQEILKTVGGLPVMSHGQCETAIRTTRLGGDFTLDPTFMCAGGTGADLCTGDGGSPLVCPDAANPARFVQVGIVAWGIGCGQVGIPGVYSSVDAALPWIMSQLTTDPNFDIRSVSA